MCLYVPLRRTLSHGLLATVSLSLLLPRTVQLVNWAAVSLGHWTSLTPYAHAPPPLPSPPHPYSLHVIHL